MTSQINVFRLESPESGNGPWWHSIGGGYAIRLYKDSMIKGDDPELHPVPLFDVPEWENRPPGVSYIFGCASMRRLNEWFPCQEGRMAMARHLKLMHYKVDIHKVLMGDKQVAFLRKGIMEKIAVDLCDFQDYVDLEREGKLI